MDKPETRSPVSEAEERVQRVDVNLIRDNPYQSRFRAGPKSSDERDTEERFLLRLAESIRARELFHPLVVTKTKNGEIRLVSGTARRNALLLAIKKFPEEEEKFRHPLCLFIDRPSEEEWMQRTYEENSIRRDIHPVKEAEYFQYLKTQQEMTQKEVADYLGVSEAHVSSRLSLLKQEEIRRQVEQSQLTATAARKEVWRRGRETSARARTQNQRDERTVSRVWERRKEFQGEETKDAPDPLPILRDIALSLEDLLKRVEGLEPRDNAVDRRAVQVVLDQIVERALRMRRAILR